MSDYPNGQQRQQRGTRMKQKGVKRVRFTGESEVWSKPLGGEKGSWGAKSLVQGVPGGGGLGDQV